MNKYLDYTDRKILNILQQDARLEIKQIAGLVNKSSSPVHHRIRKLQDEGYIKRYIAVLDMSKIGKPLLAISHVTLSDHSSQSLTNFEKQVNALPEVTLCLHLSGPIDFVLHVAVTSADSYHDFQVERLCKIPHVSNVNTCFVLKECKVNMPYPL